MQANVEMLGDAMKESLKNKSKSQLTNENTTQKVIVLIICT